MSESTVAGGGGCCVRLSTGMFPCPGVPRTPDKASLSTFATMCSECLRGLFLWRKGATTGKVNNACKLQALLYDILPSTTAVFSYAIGSRKLSANEQFFAGAQTVVSLLQTTQIKQDVSFIAANKVYTSTNKTSIV